MNWPSASLSSETSACSRSSSAGGRAVEARYRTGWLPRIRRGLHSSAWITSGGPVPELHQRVDVSGIAHRSTVR